MRLLRLHPNLNKNESLVATFFLTALTDLAGQYKALSCCWGDTTARGSITLETASGGETQHFRISITESLEDALLDLRFLCMERVIWADALCINQSDDEKKSTQVAQMFDVYRCSL